MRWIAVLLLVASCKSKSGDGAAGSAEPRISVTDPIGFCGRARAVLTARRKCFPEDTSIKMGLEELSGIESGAPTEPAGRRRDAAKCAVMLDGMMRVEQPANCPLDMTDSEATELEAFLKAWNADKNKVAPK